MRNVRSIIKVSTIVIVGLLIVGYSGYEARNIIAGPIIKVSEPQTGSAIDTPIIAVKGTAQNISAISINDRPITVDSEGAFNEKLLLSPGYNIIKLVGMDKFGRHTEKVLELVLTEHKSFVSIQSQELN